jgi:hypothetical protein
MAATSTAVTSENGNTGQFRTLVQEAKRMPITRHPVWA